MLTPRENLKLCGHQKARDTFLKAFHSDRFPQAWIVGGPAGIGKATFAFHMARYILSGRQDGNTVFLERDSLHRRLVAKSHGDLWVLGEEDAQEIGIESVRDLNRFLTQTPCEGGWQVVIIDGADRLNRNAANALLKRLEEPPLKTVFFLTTAFPGQLLSTIRSRCQMLSLMLLLEEEVEEVLRSQGFSPPAFLSIEQGSPGRLMRLMEGEGASIYADLQKILKGDSATALIQTYGGEGDSYALIEDFLRIFLHMQLLEKVEGKKSHFENCALDQALATYEKIQNLFDQCRSAQLDRKATLTCVFTSLEKRNAA